MRLRRRPSGTQSVGIVLVGNVGGVGRTDREDRTPRLAQRIEERQRPGLGPDLPRRREKILELLERRGRQPRDGGRRPPRVRRGQLGAP